MQHEVYRSLLFAPGDRVDRVEKAATLACDAVVIELEDGVRPENKVNARRNAETLIGTLNFGTRASVVRVNSLDSEFGEDDLQALSQWDEFPDQILLPKVESPDDVARWAELCESRPNCGTGLIALIETPLGVHRLWEIAQSTKRLCALSFGPVDLSTNLGAKLSWDSLLLARTMLVNAAAGASLLAIDGPCLDLDGVSLLTEESKKARDMGYSGKLVLHPRQLDIVNETFTPSKDELAKAERILEAAQQHGEGALRLDGKMVDRPVVERARKLVRLADRLPQRARRAAASRSERSRAKG